MIGVIGPLVQGKRELRGSVSSVAIFAAAAILGAALTGVVVGLIGGVVQSVFDERTLAIAVGVAGAVLLVADLGLLGLRSPTLRRQTCSTWYLQRGPRSVWKFWGFDLGLGFSTIRLSSLYWLMVLFVAAFVSPVLAPLALAFYGLGLGVAFAAAVVAQAWSTPSTTSPGLGLLHAAATVRLVSVGFLGFASLLILTWGATWP
ncbi:MAG TPA: hypothetical protein VH420_05995 [Gaiellaceae bacterium]|jgi:hypothetical protein